MHKLELVDKELAFLRLSRVVHKASKEEKFIADFEKSLTRMLTAEWQDTANKGVKSAMGAFSRASRTPAGVKSIKAALAKAVSGYGREIEAAATSQVETFYKEMTARFVKEHKLVAKAVGKGPSFTASFSKQDANAIKVIQQLTVQTAGRYFPDQLEAKTSEVIERVVLNEGLDTKAAAERLEQELRSALGTDAFEATLPVQFATNPQAYFDIVAVNASTQATNVGRVISMSDAGIEKYEIVAVMDSRTSSICQGLNGKTFSVGNSMKSVSSFLKVESLTELEDMMPFSKTDKTPEWAEKGLGFPPYHHKCRTRVLPVV